MSAHKIEKKITKVRVVKPGEKEKAEAEAAAAAKAREPVADPRGSNIIRMHEKLERPEELIGSRDVRDHQRHPAERRHGA